MTAEPEGYAQARRFLSRLDPEADGYTFQTFDDTPAKRPQLARILQGPFDKAAPVLSSFQKQHAGVFVTVCATDLKGRQAHNVVGVRALFADLDGAPLAPVLAAGLEPHIVCESSPGRYHAYWRCDDCPLDKFEAAQRAIAARFGSDPSVHDLPRVMRLPGFVHAKGEPFKSRMMEELCRDAPAYHLAEIVAKLGLVLDPHAAPRVAGSGNGDGGKIEPGDRHSHLFATGRAMAKRGLSLSAVAAALSAENAARCAPPLAQKDLDYLAMRAFSAKDARTWDEAKQRDAQPPPDNSKSDKTKFPRVWIDDAEPDVDADYLIKGLIERTAMHVIFGPSGDGKTFFTIDMACRIAQGAPWRDRRVRRGLVVYVAAEAGVSILRRFCAWRDRNISDSAEGRTPLSIITRSTNLMNQEAVQCLLDELREITKEAGMPVSLVIFDTLSRSMPGGEENKTEDMSRVIAASDVIRDEVGAGTLIVHHSGKDPTKGMRGNSSLFAAADVVISVIDKVATVDKSRDGTGNDVFPFSLEVVDLGLDSDGEKRTTCLISHNDDCAQKEAGKQRKLSSSAQVCFDALKTAIDEHGEMLPQTSAFPKVRAVTAEQWQDAYCRIRPINQKLDAKEVKRERNARRMAFLRGQNDLQASRIAGTELGFWWIL